jgi:hypothetical protein
MIKSGGLVALTPPDPLPLLIRSSGRRNQKPVRQCPGADKLATFERPLFAEYPSDAANGRVAGVHFQRLCDAQAKYLILT